MQKSGKSTKMVQWVCTKCGRKTRAVEKPGATCAGKCKGSNAGVHSYVKA